jgi:hypothetical protein
MKEISKRERRLWMFLGCFLILLSIAGVIALPDEVRRIADSRPLYHRNNQYGLASGLGVTFVFGLLGIVMIGWGIGKENIDQKVSIRHIRIAAIALFIFLIGVIAFAFIRAF